MKSTIREYGFDSVDVIAVAGSYKQSHIAGKFNMRAHFLEGLVSRQDSTWGSAQPFVAPTPWSAADPAALDRQISLASLTSPARTGFRSI